MFSIPPNVVASCRSQGIVLLIIGCLILFALIAVVCRLTRSVGLPDTQVSGTTLTTIQSLFFSFLWDDSVVFRMLVTIASFRPVPACFFLRSARHYLFCFFVNECNKSERSERMSTIPCQSASFFVLPIVLLSLNSPLSRAFPKPRFPFLSLLLASSHVPW